jgi:hypothetical protein
MTHPLGDQLRFTRGEFRRALRGLRDDEARKRFLPMNCISWNIGHLAWQEQRYFLFYGQGQMPLPEINETFATGAPACTPALDEMWAAWKTVTSAADPWLDALTVEKLQDHVVRNGKLSPYLFGSLLQRVIYHYWYHLGENMAIRQMLGRERLPQFVGDLDGQAPYRPEGQTGDKEGAG